MGKVTMQGVQTMLHLDVPYPDFETWQEVLDFEVDGVAVQAIATHRWREDTVKIIKPFQVEGEQYGYSCRPPLMALGAAMLGRRSALEARGSSVRDDCIRMATGTYREHAIYLRLKPQIEREQATFSSQRRDELQRLAHEAARAQEHFRVQRLELRRKLQSKEIEPKAYQLSLRSLQEPAQACQGKYRALQAKIERGLQEIKMKVIRHALTDTGAAEPS